MRTVLAAIVCAALASAACAASQAAAARDPMRCERDPSCKNHDKAFDCSSQCADDPACVDRCTQVQAETGAAAPH